MSRRVLHSERVNANRRAPIGVTANPESVVLTEAAAQEILRQAAKRENPDSIMRVSLRGGGCSGYTYHFDWDDGEARKTDFVIENHGAAVRIDHRSMRLLKGTILDYKRTLMKSGFAFHNPNATGTCGCGKSASF